MTPLGDYDGTGFYEYLNTKSTLIDIFDFACIKYENPYASKPKQM